MNLLKYRDSDHHPPRLSDSVVLGGNAPEEKMFLEARHYLQIKKASTSVLRRVSRASPVKTAAVKTSNTIEQQLTQLPDRTEPRFGGFLFTEDMCVLWGN